MEQNGFVETDVKTSLGSITLEIIYALTVEDGEYNLDIQTVTNSAGADLNDVFDNSVLVDEVYECLGISPINGHFY
jgi:hypothetical protein